MKRILYLTCILMLVHTVCNAQSGRKYRYVKPVKTDERIHIEVKGKKRNYYPVTLQKPATILLRGPGKLIIRSRAAFNPEAREKMSYRIAYVLDGELKQEATLTSHRADNARYIGDKVRIPGTLEELEIELGR